MPLDRVLGQFFDALGDHAVGRPERWCRAGSLPLLPLIVLAGFVVITALAYASPQDPTWFAGLYDAADYDDKIELLTDAYRHPNPVGEPGQRVAFGPMSAVLTRVAPCSLPTVFKDAVLFAYRLRAPPKRLGHGHSLSSHSSRSPIRSRLLPQSSPFQQQPSDLQAVMLLARVRGQPSCGLVGDLADQRGCSVLMRIVMEDAPIRATLVPIGAARDLALSQIGSG